MGAKYSVYLKCQTKSFLALIDFAVRLSNKVRTGPRSAARFKPEVYPRSKLTKCLKEEEEQQQLK